MIQQRLSQKLQQKLSPQQIQLMKLLQVPTAALEQRIKEELEVNPALEEGNPELGSEYEDQVPNEEESDFELDEYIQDYMEDDPYSYKLRQQKDHSEEQKTIPIAEEQSFHNYLEDQLYLLDFKSEEEQQIAQQIIGSIDSDGYLRRDITSIMDDLMFAQNIFVTTQEIASILNRIQQLEPSGIAARNLQECLLIQINQRLEAESLTHFEHIEPMALAQEILELHFDTFSKKHYNKLQEKLDISEAQLKAAIEEILLLNPKPASGFDSNTRNNRQYIVPDFAVVNESGELKLSLNSRNAPTLKVNEQYQGMLRTYAQHKTSDAKSTVQFIKQKIDSAKWFIDAIQQRQQTLYRTMYAILEYQKAYFKTGDKRELRPMILKDIAEITSLDISTISRVVNSKFVQTEFGIKRLKEFFSDSLQTDSGEEVSTIEVKDILEEIIAQESKKKPLSDEKLAKALQEKGYNIARRTVTKYREQLNIPVARLRKEL